MKIIEKMSLVAKLKQQIDEFLSQGKVIEKLIFTEREWNDLTESANIAYFETERQSVGYTFLGFIVEIEDEKTI